ncbi:MAG TPA: hypothetical protein VFE58_13115 [Tepidisphaeraceae bacterium]|jgi:hypothetical protein|nr:hypothetical protein [Tepidisphaeraceae bacterium]
MNRLPLLLALLFPLPALTGCNIIGAGAVLADKIVPSKTDAQYKGLAGQSVGVMVWCDRGIRIDYPAIQIDCATSIQNKLSTAQKADVKELKDTKFPVPAPSIARYQFDNPQSQSRPITEVAPHLANKTGLTRLIYVEIDGFSTRPAPGVELFRGSMTGSVHVIDIKDGKARAVYDESDVHAAFPKKSPEEGSPNLDDQKVYMGTMNEFTTQIARRFVSYEDDDD